jgi:oligosaccharide reducing-end xylanase
MRMREHLGLAGLAATDRARAKEFTEALWNTPIPSGQNRYYDGMLYLMSLMHLGREFRILEPKQRESITTLLSRGAQ